MEIFHFLEKKNCVLQKERCKVPKPQPWSPTGRMAPNLLIGDAS